eukprot:TRINITY_DN55095_c0_g1_i1.p1 TRINITY_DN55095_c0_g1~~TRINITY_DN55095_c0_g1_i1.p1  ORF type:complete len:513 (+),score=92.66 TRINITY_DN55095_c0_g1_i1:34-1572(+)
MTRFVSRRLADSGMSQAVDLGFASCGLCPCCLPPIFDAPPVGLPVATRTSRGKQLPFDAMRPLSLRRRNLYPLTVLRATACSSETAVDGSGSLGEAGVATGGDERRNVIAEGMDRFERNGPLPTQPEWEALSPRVLCVLAKNPSPYTLNGTNCYLVGTGRLRLLIDTGEHKIGSDAFMECLRDCMQQNGVEGLEGIIVTHAHHDHYGNVKRLLEVYGKMPVYVRDKTRPPGGYLGLFKERDVVKFFLNAETGEPFFDPWSKQDNEQSSIPDDLDLKWAESFVSFFPGKNTLAKVKVFFWYLWELHTFDENLRTGVYDWRPLQDGDVIRTEGATLTAMSTPGHAEDHTAFVFEEEHAIFSGDNVLGWGTSAVVDLSQYMQSLRRMLAVRPTRLYPGHGRFIEDGEHVLRRYINHRESREVQAWEVLRKSVGMVRVDDVVQELYPNIGKAQRWMARDNVEKIMRKLAADGAVGAWTESEGGIVPAVVPNSYLERRLNESWRWAAKSSLVRASKL